MIWENSKYFVKPSTISHKIWVMSAEITYLRQVTSLFQFVLVRERFHSRGQHLCMRKERNSQRIFLVHQHGRRFIVLKHQYGRRDVMWKRSIGWKFSSTNKRHYPDLGSDTSSVWNFCARFSDVISRENQSGWRREASAVFRLEVYRQGWYGFVAFLSFIYSQTLIIRVFECFFKSPL